MITAQIERVTDIWPEVEPFLPLHWEELGLWRDKMPLNPNREEYFRLDAEGALTAATVREDGRLIAYVDFFVRRHLHYWSTLCASMDVIYLAPEHRGNGTGRLLGETALAELKRRGVGPVMGGSKNHKGIEGFWLALGLMPIETILGLWIGD